VSAPTPSPTLLIPLPGASHTNLAVAVFLLLLLGTSTFLWWQVRREYRRRTEEAMRRMGPPDD
jgi:hypothetical protein